MAAAPPADILNVCAHLDENVLRPLYVAADAVLANSWKEPFGLVGLEAMAAGGVAVVGMTGEDYALDRWNSIVMQQNRPEELVERLDELLDHPAQARRLRQHARQSARRFTWVQAVFQLVDRATAIARVQGAPMPSRAPEVRVLPAAPPHRFVPQPRPRRRYRPPRISGH